MIAGDDDHKLENNPGRVKALEAAAAVNGVAIFPELRAEQREQGMTDFNELGRAQPEVVSRQLVATVNVTREGRMIRLGWSDLRSQSALNFWGVTLDPPPDGDAIGVQAPLGQQLLHITIGKRKAQIPADRKQDHLRFKLAPLEQTGSGGCEDHIGPAYQSTPVNGVVKR
jgi:hypothetical protein